MKLKVVVAGLVLSLFASDSKAVDPSVAFYIDNIVYKSAKIVEFDIMAKANGSTSTYNLRTFQAGLYVNPSWVNGGVPAIQNVSTYSEMDGPGYNGVFQWNATDKLINCSVNFDVYQGPTTCISTTVSTTPLLVTKIRLTNTVDFSCASTPDIKFNYVSNISPLRLRTSFSWREVGCSLNYDMFYPGRTYGGSATFNGEVYSAGDVDGRSPVGTVNNDGFCDAQLTLTAFIQGYYTGGGTMQPVLSNQMVEHASSEETDSVTVELHFTSPPSVLSKKVILNTNGIAYVILPTSYVGQSCNIAIKHRNSIQTWSSSPVVLTNRHTYNFATTSSATYADNVAMVDGSTFAIYTGDINQDDFIDIFDFPSYDSDNQNFILFEYVPTDLNGDGFVDIFDFPVYDANNQNFVFAIYP